MPQGVHRHGEPSHREKMWEISHIEVPTELLHQG